MKINRNMPPHKAHIIFPFHVNNKHKTDSNKLLIMIVKYIQCFHHAFVSFSVNIVAAACCIRYMFYFDLHYLFRSFR